MTTELIYPNLDPAIEVLAGTDVDDVWHRFEVFEALHHSLSICNPMTSAQLDALVETLELHDGHDVLDVACGYGEILIRASVKARITGTGVDLSPWMVSRARTVASYRAPEADLRWVLGEARNFHADQTADVAVCVGAEWIWHDFRGTARALATRVRRGGQVVIGAARLHHAADADSVATSHGAVDTVDDMALALREFGLEPSSRIDPDDAGWDTYLARTARAVGTWAERFPGERAQQWVAEQADWQAARERDRAIIGWSVWTATKVT